MITYALYYILQALIFNNHELTKEIHATICRYVQNKLNKIWRGNSCNYFYWNFTFRSPFHGKSKKLRIIDSGRYLDGMPFGILGAESKKNVNLD